MKTTNNLTENTNIANACAFVNSFFKSDITGFEKLKQESETEQESKQDEMVK